MRKKIERETPPPPPVALGPTALLLCAQTTLHAKRRRKKKKTKKKDDVNDDALANGIERAARFVLVFSAHGHVARHERRRGHVLFHGREEEEPAFWSVTLC